MERSTPWASGVGGYARAVTDETAAGTDPVSEPTEPMLPAEATVDDAGTSTGTDVAPAVEGASTEAAAESDRLPATTRTVVLEVPADRLYTGATGAADREWTHDPLEKSFLSACGRGYAVGVVLIWILTFLVLRVQATDWGAGAAVGAAFVVAAFAGILGGVVLVGLWAMHNEEAIRGNESGHRHPEAEGEASPGFTNAPGTF
jgi:hypothetical protein